jgi:hypothetical protein
MTRVNLSTSLLGTIKVAQLIPIVMRVFKDGGG